MSSLYSIHALPFIEALLKHQSFTKAAKDLYISQPYLTQFIKKLEEELGDEIINRQSPQLQLTETGKLYYDYLVAAEKDKQQLFQTITEARTTDAVKLKICILSSLATYLLPLTLPKFLERYPSVSINITEDIPRNNEMKALSGEIDFYIGQNPETVSPSLNVEAVGSHLYYAIIPTQSRFYQEGQTYLPANTIAMNELLAEPLVLTKSGSAIRRQIDRLCQRYGVTAQVILESENIYTVSQLSQHNAGVTFIPESIIGYTDQHLSFNLYPINADLISVDFFIAYQSNRQLSQFDQAFIGTFRDKIRQI